MANVDLQLATGEHPRVHHFSVSEVISRDFHIQLVVNARDDLDPSDIVAKPASFTLSTPVGERAWTGVIASVEQAELGKDGRATYNVELVADLWLLKNRTRYRTFQHQTAAEIARTILADWDIEPVVKLSAKQPKLAFKVQYGESDYDFLRRTLIDAGISYSFAFEPESRRTLMILSDAPEQRAPLTEPVRFDRDFDEDAGGSPSRRTLYEVSVAAKTFAPRVTIADYDFRRPRQPVLATHDDRQSPHALFEQRRFEHGSSLAEISASGSSTPLADAHGSYRAEEEHARARAERDANRARSTSSKVTYRTTHVDLGAGTTFTVAGHPHPEMRSGLLVIESWISGGSADELACGGEAVPTNRPYVSSLNEASEGPTSFAGSGTKKETPAKGPRIQGVQTAVVVGPEGDDVYVDEHGRVRIQFAWDTDGAFDERSSCWVRVSQAAASAGSGYLQLPRVGEEVLVSFIDGDPEHPIIVGRLHNPTSPAPYAPAAHKSRATWKSPSASGTGNEITFDSRPNAELFYLQAQKDLSKIVMRDELEHTLGSRHVTIDGDLILSAKGKIVLQSESTVIVKGATPVVLDPPGAAPAPRRPAELSSGVVREEAVSAAARQNAALFELDPGSMKDAQKTAEARVADAKKYKGLAEKLGAKHDVPPALLLAMMSQESSFGRDLKGDGYSKKDGFGYGLLQVDRRYHEPSGGDPFGEEGAEQGVVIFKQSQSAVDKSHPSWTSSEKLAASLVEYNAGPGSATTQPSSAQAFASLDAPTGPSGDYARTIWSQATWFAQNLKW